MSSRSFVTELRRRNVIRAGVLYAGAVWALAQGIAQLGPSIGLPDWTTRWFLVASMIGFPFWLAFAWFFEFTPSGLKRESQIDPADSVAHSTGRRLDFWIIGVMALAIVLLLTNQLVTRRDVASDAASHAADALITASEKSIAVLPLTNESGEKDQQYFSDGLSEDLITALSQFSGLKVISRHSSFQFRDSSEDSKTIGAKLGVAHLLEGSVRRAGDEVRISAELVNVADGSTLWSQRYDRPYKDLFKLQDDITQAVAEALKTKLLPGNEVIQRDRPPSGNLDAYNAFLQGNFYGTRNTFEDTRRAIARYQEAVRIDPKYALAYARLSNREVELNAIFGRNDKSERDALFTHGRVAANTALALQPNLPEAHTAHGYILRVLDFDLAGAYAEYKRAAELGPQNEPLGSLGILSASFGRLDEAVAYGRRSVAMNPLESGAYINLARSLNALGRYDEAEAVLRRSIDINPHVAQSYVELTVVQILRGHTADVARLAGQENDPFWRAYALAIADAAHGDQAEADAALKQLIDKYADTGAFQIAQVYALRKEPDKMFQWLDHAFAVRDAGMTSLRYAAFVRDYSADPRFAVLCRQMGLPAPAAKSPPTSAAAPVAVPSPAPLDAGSTSLQP